MNKAEITRLSCKLTEKQMREFLLAKYGVAPKDFRRVIASLLPKESYYQAKIIKHIQQAYPNSFVWKAAAGAYTRAGIPDVNAVIGGRFYGFEVKRPYIGRLSEIQRKTIRDINAAGGVAGAVVSPDDCDKMIRGGNANGNR